MISEALELPVQTLVDLRPFDPDQETGDEYDARTAEAFSAIQAVGGLPVVVGSASVTAFLVNVDQNDERDDGQFSLLEAGGVLAITIGGVVILFRPNAEYCADCGSGLPCPFHDGDDDD
jgi:hypothetical protein